MKKRVTALFLVFCLSANVFAAEIITDTPEFPSEMQPEEILPELTEETEYLPEPDSAVEPFEETDATVPEEESAEQEEPPSSDVSVNEEQTEPEELTLLPEMEGPDSNLSEEETSQMPDTMPETETDPHTEDQNSLGAEQGIRLSANRESIEGMDDETPEDRPWEEEDFEYGGYEFAGYLEDGTPNFVWEGPGEPSEIGNELVLDRPQTDSEYPDESYTLVTPENEPPEGNNGESRYETQTEQDQTEEAGTQEPISEEPVLEGPDSEGPVPEGLDSEGSVPEGSDSEDPAFEETAAEEENPEEPESTEPEGLPDVGAYLRSATIPLRLRPLFSPHEEEISPLLSAMPEDFEETSSASLSSSMPSDIPVRVKAVDSSATRGEPVLSGNYIKDPERQAGYHGYTRMSDSFSPQMVDGIHTEDGGRRVYKGGRYFEDGAVALDGVSYYTDSDGYLISGWLKTLSEEIVADPASILADDHFVFRYYDPDTNERLTGYQVVDGLGHFFILSSGIMSRDYARMLDGVYYYSDRYGICNQVKLSYGNVIISQDNQNNDAYLAKNMVQAVDIDTFTGQNGEYSFRPRWYTDKSQLEIFGFSPLSSPHGYYCALTDNSMKGNIGCIYRNVGRYKGREVDLRLTVLDYEFFSKDGDQEVGYFLVFNNAIGLNACNVRTITADLQFLDHETGQPVVVKGYATFSDIDISQSLTILSDVDEVFVDKNCVLFKDPGSLAFTAPFITSRNGSAVNDKFPEYWVQANYHSDHLTYRFGAAYDQYRFIDGSLINGESHYVWLDGYTGNPGDYNMIKDDGNLRQSWQGLYFQRLGRVSIPPLTKTVTDLDEEAVTENRLGRADEPFEFILSHDVPGESERFYYDSYQITDTIHEDLKIDSDRCKVTNDKDEDVSARFVLTISGQNITCAAKPEWLSNDDFYNSTYHLHIGVQAKDPSMFNEYTDKDYEVRNFGEASFTRSAGPEETKSNETVTRYRIPYVTVIQKDSETGDLLKDAEFTLYAYDRSQGDFKKDGERLTYNEKEKKYESKGLLVTEENDKDGKGTYAFLLRETKAPRGYVDDGFEEEIILSGDKTVYELTVENKPDIPPLGKITITKRILEADIIWAHGNPTFLFSAEGDDIKGDHHRYEDYLCFSQGGYTLDGNGYAVLSLTIEDVPIGTYDICELPVMDYFLIAAEPGSSNVSIRSSGSSSYGTGVLTREEPEAGIIFTDQKGDDHGYRHTDVVRNTIPLALS